LFTPPTSDDKPTKCVAGWPQAVERVGLGGEPVWLRDELLDSVSVEDGEGRP